MPSRPRDTLTIWSEETTRDRRNVRWAVVAAVVVHALVFRLQLPETVAAEAVRLERAIHVTPLCRFRPPPPRNHQKLPEPRVRRVPVPDPTPDDPEPLAVPEEVVVSVDLPRGDLFLDLPAEPPPSPPQRPMRVGGDVLPPVKTFAPPPRYTELARRARIEGNVIVEAVIDASGTVTRLRVLKSLPLGLDQSAVDAVSRWRFAPATYNGKPVPVLYNLTVRFRLT